MNKKYKDVKYYLDLEWTYTIETHKTKGKKYFVIRVNELPGICTDAETIAEGIKAIREPIQAAIEIYIQKGEPVPVPLTHKSKRKFGTAKGQIVIHGDFNEPLPPEIFNE